MQIATLRLLIAIALGLTLGLWSTTASAVTDNQEAICDQSYVIFCDNFEERALGSGDLGRPTYKVPTGWQYSNPYNGSSPSIVNAPGTAFSGTHGLEIRTAEGSNAGGG